MLVEEEDGFGGDMMDEKLLTYRRRRVSDENPDPQEVGCSSDTTNRKRKKPRDIGWVHGEMTNGIKQHWHCTNRRVSDENPSPQEGCSTHTTNRKRKKKTKDIGWVHGEMANGIKHHWRCNYCGTRRHGGGVTRLKLHLIGHRDVRKCPNVPDAVAEEIARQHLFFKEEEMPPLMNLNWSCKRERKGMRRRRTKPVCLVERTEEIIDVEEYDDNEPKKGLEDDMQLSSLSCMVERHENNNNEVLSADETTHAITGKNNDFERHAQVGNGAEDLTNENHDKSCKHVLKNGNRDNSTGIENGGSSGGVHGFIHKALSLIQAHNDSQVVCMGEKSEKCWNALVGILKSDKFALLCDLFRNNFRIDASAERSYLDFGEIDSKMKNGDYEQSPKLFGHDIMKLWKNMEHVGQEMVRLAANLSSISRVNIEDKIGIIIPDPDEPTDPYSAPYCNHCRYEITNDWGLIRCNGCSVSYHTSCINPLIHDSIQSWYCSACISNNSEPVTPCITSIYKLCKICGTRASDGKKDYLICSHPECPYKYYHVSCLKKPQIGTGNWYCPSCLCRVCRYDADDPLIVLCDGCDEAYHIYCMDPPRESVPEGAWHCGKCERKRKKGKRGKAWNDRMGSLGVKGLKKEGIGADFEGEDVGRNGNERRKMYSQSLDLLVSAVDAVSAQED